MFLNIPLCEVISLMRTQTDKPITLGVVDNDTLAVGYEVKVKIPLLGEISKEIIINLQIERIQDEILYLHLESDGIGFDLILNGILAAYPTFVSTNIIEVYGERLIKIHLREVERLRNVLDRVTINTISFKDDCALVDFSLKSL